MKIIILNGSPRRNGNTHALVEAFIKGAQEKHEIHCFDICSMNIHGCLGCDYCRKNNRKCMQKDDMHKIYSVLDEADMIVIASPIYYHSLSGQLQCAINRIYALDKPLHLKYAGLILSSGDKDVYDGAIYEYKQSFLNYLKLENKGIYTAYDKQNKTEDKLKELYLFGKNL